MEREKKEGKHTRWVYEEGGEEYTVTYDHKTGSRHKRWISSRFLHSLPHVGEKESSHFSEGGFQLLL